MVIRAVPAAVPVGRWLLALAGSSRPRSLLRPSPAAVSSRVVVAMMRWMLVALPEGMNIGAIPALTHPMCHPERSGACTNGAWRMERSRGIRWHRRSPPSVTLCHPEGAAHSRAWHQWGSDEGSGGIHRAGYSASHHRTDTRSVPAHARISVGTDLVSVRFRHAGSTPPAPVDAEWDGSIERPPGGQTRSMPPDPSTALHHQCHVHPSAAALGMTHPG